MKLLILVINSYNRSICIIIALLVETSEVLYWGSSVICVIVTSSLNSVGRDVWKGSVLPIFLYNPRLCCVIRWVVGGFRLNFCIFRVGMG